ncbi:fimbrial protein [Scandinavium goeteborgense]|uniref:fimbrial protein n=1 Tax=Scandinavium goeteborgense TaxID=1851514 RepID=UPI00381CEA61
MSKFKVAMCALAISLASGYVQAAEPVPPAPVAADTQGVVTFTGKLIAETCIVDDTSKDIQVTLPTLSTTSLAAAGDEGGSSTFTINVKSCPAEITKVAAHFEAIDATKFNAVTGNLINQDLEADGGATNVEVRLFEADGTVIPVGSTGSSFAVDATDGTAALTYVGAYYATAATTAGTVKAQVQYTLAYP